MREIPGFLAIAVILMILFIREQVQGMIALALLGVATAVTAWFPSLGGILMLTLLSSIGFHYFETVNQSLQLQWIDKARAPQMLGWITAAGAGASLLAYGLIVVLWEPLGLTYNSVYLASGGLTALIAVFACLPIRSSRRPTRRTSIWCCGGAIGFTTCCSSWPARGGRFSWCSRPS